MKKIFLMVLLLSLDLSCSKDDDSDFLSLPSWLRGHWVSATWDAEVGIPSVEFTFTSSNIVVVNNRVPDRSYNLKEIFSSGDFNIEESVDGTFYKVEISTLDGSSLPIGGGSHWMQWSFEKTLYNDEEVIINYSQGQSGQILRKE